MSAPHLPSPAPSPFTTNGSAPEDPARARAELEAQLLKLSQDLYEMEVCAGDVTPGREDMVPQYLAKINASFIALANMAPQITDTVPRTIVDHVDRYKNPHQYTKTALSRATGENQYALGRVLGLESFRRQLHDSVEEAFPGVPLPERRHHPIKPEPEPETQPNGVAEVTATGVNNAAANGTVGANGSGTNGNTGSIGSTSYGNTGYGHEQGGNGYGGGSAAGVSAAMEQTETEDTEETMEVVRIVEEEVERVERVERAEPGAGLGTDPASELGRRDGDGDHKGDKATVEEDVVIKSDGL